jgi:hypothetical protein
MSRRQHERVSRFQAEVETSLRVAAVAFRDDDVERSILAAVRLWWRSGLRGRRFVQLIQRAREITQARVSVGAVQRGQPGRREAMPYFFTVLCDLVKRDCQRINNYSRINRKDAVRARS